jgi:hypothetical protein
VARTAPSFFAAKHFFDLGVRPGSMMIRREAFEAAGWFDEHMRFNEDSDLIQRLAIGHRAIFSKYPSILQRHHGSNKSSNRVQIYRALLSSMEKILAQYPEFVLSVGEKRAHERLGQVCDIISMLEREPVETDTSVFLVWLFERVRHLLRRIYRKTGNLLLRREEVIHCRKIVGELEALIL